MLLNDGNGERASAYRFLAALFSHPPDGEELDVIRQELELTSRDNEFSIFEDYNRLFGPEGALPPLESLNNPEGGDTAAEGLAATYQETGLTFYEEYELVVDHLAVEFLFMSYLVEAGDLDRQKRFLEEHLAGWVPEYCDRVAAEAGTGFYREIAAATRQFVEQEYAAFT